MSEFIRPAPDSQFRLRPCVCGSEYVVYQPSTEEPRPFYRVMCMSCWNRLPADLLAAAGRLKGVQIEHQNALDLIRKFNHDNVLIYADPPYLLETRGGKQYRHEMTEQDHLDLLEALKQHKGSVILSGYPSEMYDRELRGWSVIHRKSYNQNADPRTEVLWCNFETPGLFGGLV